MTESEILGMSPYHAGAGVIVNAGAICMLAFVSLDVPHPWIGFFVGAIPVYVVLAKAMEAENDHDAQNST